MVIWKQELKKLLKAQNWKVWKRNKMTRKRESGLKYISLEFQNKRREKRYFKRKWMRIFTIAERAGSIRLQNHNESSIDNLQIHTKKCNKTIMKVQNMEDKENLKGTWRERLLIKRRQLYQQQTSQLQQCNPKVEV